MVQVIRTEKPRIETHLSHASVGIEGTCVRRDRLFDILQTNHLLVKPKSLYHITTNSHQRFRKHKNLIVNIESTHPKEIQMSDITYTGSIKQEEPTHISESALSSKTAATYSPTVTQYHRRDEA